MGSKLSVFVILVLVALLLGLAGCIYVTAPSSGTPTAPATIPSSPIPPVPTPPSSNAPATTLPAVPTINSFSATPGNISFGSSATLSWDVSDATSVSITGVGNVASSGSTMVSPGATTNYILMAANAAGTVTATTQVSVFQIIGLPVINSFIATPPSFVIGSSTLSWNVSNATSVSITGVGNVGSVGSVAVSPATTTQYTLTASNPAGTVYHTIQVTRIKLQPIQPVQQLQKNIIQQLQP